MRRAVWIVLLLVFAAACQAAKPDPAAEKLARAFYDDLRTGQNESLQSRLPAKLRNAPALAEILRLRRLIPAGQPTASKVVGTEKIETQGKDRAEVVSIEYDYPNHTNLLQVSFYKPSTGGDPQIFAVKMKTATDAELARNRFTLAGKGPMQLGFLAYAIFVPLLILGAMAKVAATPGLRNKWVFVVLSAVGVCTLQMNWTTGALWVDWYTVQVIGSGATRGLSSFDPWIIKANLPLGALLILGGLLANPRTRTTRIKAPTQG